MSVPSTPTNPKPPTLPVRYVIVSSEKNMLGEYDVFSSTYASMKDAQVDAESDEHVYILLPPHLADEWRRLRMEKAKAERALHDAMNVKARFLDAQYVEWADATHALAAFEKQYGIGGAE